MTHCLRRLKLLVEAVRNSYSVIRLSSKVTDSDREIVLFKYLCNEILRLVEYHGLDLECEATIQNFERQNSWVKLLSVLLFLR